MTDTLEIIGFETSNNMKVRVACGFKGIPFRWRAIDPVDRAEVVSLSGQPLTPVMRHRGATLFDSAAIVRYLETNFLDTPRLFDADRDTMRAIERWEGFGTRTLLGPLIEVATMRIRGAEEPETLARATRDFGHGARELAAGLGTEDWLVAGRMTAAEVFTAPLVYRVHSAGILPLPEGLETLMEWVDRVMRHDPGVG